MVSRSILGATHIVVAILDHVPPDYIRIAVAIGLVEADEVMLAQQTRLMIL
jgi:hypothetical protein